MNILNNNKGSGGIGFFGLLGVVFIALKLAGTIQWSWLWVTAPLWGGFILWILFAIVLVVIAAISQ